MNRGFYWPVCRSLGRHVHSHGISENAVRVSDSSREPGKLVLMGGCVTEIKGGRLMFAGSWWSLKWDQESGLPPVAALMSAAFLDGRKGAALSK